MRIAYIAPGRGTSLQRAKALERLGHEVVLIDPWEWLARPAWRMRVFYHTGYNGVGALINKQLYVETCAAKPDLIWVNQGEFFDLNTIKKLKVMNVPIVNYSNDNPFSRENHKRFSRYRTALPFYDLVVVVFQEAVAAAKHFGARKVIRKFISADEIAHCISEPNTTMESLNASEVAFVGTCLKEYRAPFMVELIKRGVPLSIWGDNWQKAPEWPLIKDHWRGPGVYDNEGYAEILQSAKICLGLVNKSSGNLHTDRSIQIPALGSLLCAERTSEHVEMYEDGKEAIFWNDAAECAALCKELLADTPRRLEIAARGRERAMRNGLFNEPVMRSILREVAT